MALDSLGNSSGNESRTDSLSTFVIVVWGAKRGRIRRVKHWKPTLAILMALSATFAVADDFRTTKGKEYKNVTVSRVESDGIVIKFKGGIVKLPFTELPSDVQKKYEYNPVAAREYAAQRDKGISRPTATPDANLRTSEPDDAQSSVKALNPAEQWVVAQATVGKIADLNKQFPQEDDRQLSADFLESLLTGTRPDVKLHRNGVRINGACIDESIDLVNAQIPCEVRLEHCQFNASVTFFAASFAAGVSFENSMFNADANFNSVTAGGVASFAKAVFEGPVDLQGAHIARQFWADEAHFKDKEKGANLGLMKVGDGAFLSDAVFEGPVNFISANITGVFLVDRAKFLNEKGTTIFNGMNVAGNVFFRKAVFEGPVNFAFADFASQFIANEAQFHNKEQSAYFNSMKVRGHVFLGNAVFKGPVNFALADFSGNFQADRVKFQNLKEVADFHGMKVRGRAFFSGTVFAGPVDFSDTDFAWLDLSSPLWRKVAAQSHMRGMSYKYIRAIPGNEPESHKALLKLANRSPYTADVYDNLEQFFVRQGYRADADEAFIAGKRREREEYFRSGDWFWWLWSWTLYLLVGYGRRPWQALFPCAFFVVLGCILFPREKMTLQDPKELEKPEKDRRIYNRLWYSLGLFLPVVDLKTSELWGPKPEYRFLRNYVRVHILLGWILIPFVLAALTGLIK